MTSSLWWVFAAAVLSQGSSQIRDEVLKLADGDELRYAISVPTGGDSKTPRPLVLALHFGWVGELPPGYGRRYMEGLVAPGLRELGAIIVAPDAPERSWTHPRSEEALLALIEHVRESHAVDGERIVVCGFSLGAMGTWFLGSRHPELISASIALAGPPVLRPVEDAPSGLAEAERFLSGDIEWPASALEMPIMVIHSRKDELVPFALIAKAVRSLRAAGGQVEFQKVKDLGHFQTVLYAEYLERTVPWLRKVWGR